MEKVSIAKELSSNKYPGRGIIVGKTADGKNMAVAYFIMGRSINSRNRVFTKTHGGIKTEAFDPAKLADPSLIIYHPVRTLGKTLIVTNGDQTDTVYEMMAMGHSFEDALRTRTFEPDEPNFTPRISAIVNGGSYRMSILKSAEGRGNSVRRYFFDYEDALPGEGHFIHTYKCDGNPIPSFEGEPQLIEINSNNIDDFTNLIWDNLNEDNKVSLYTKFINLKNGESEVRIINKNK